jgi:hypothetical protein
MSNYGLVCPPTTIPFIRSDYTLVQTDPALCILKRRSLLDISEIRLKLTEHRGIPI